jgi:hypothetical protein
VTNILVIALGASVGANLRYLLPNWAAQQLLRWRPQDLGLLPDGAPTDAPSAQHPTAPERSVSARGALREASFWWLTFVFAVSTFVTVALTVHLIPYCCGCWLAYRLPALSPFCRLQTRSLACYACCMAATYSASATASAAS